MRVINLFGGPGSGKSTTAAGLFYFMKLRHLNVELVTEYAKDLLWSDRLTNMQEQQEYIFAKQNYRLHRLRDKVDYVVTDSPLLLSYVYSKANHEHQSVPDWPAYDTFLKFVVTSFNTYDNCNILLHRPDTFQQAGRDRDEKQSKDIDIRIAQMLYELDIPHIAFNTDDNTINNIMDIIGETNAPSTTE